MRKLGPLSWWTNRDGRGVALTVKRVEVTAEIGPNGLDQYEGVECGISLRASTRPLALSLVVTTLYRDTNLAVVIERRHA